MTYREKFHNSTDWKSKVLTMEFFHLLRLTENKKWTMKNTANYFGVSLALVSENLMLAVGLREGKLDDYPSRVKALEGLKNGEKQK